MLWRPEVHEPLVDRDWNESAARSALNAIVADAEAAVGDAVWPIHPLDQLDEEGPMVSLYLGSAGMIWGLHMLGSSLDLAALLAKALERYRVKPEGDDGQAHGQAHPPSLWMGETGMLVVAAKIGSPTADMERLGELVHLNRAHPTWELLWGSPGTMLAARECGLHDEWADSAELLLRQWDQASDLWTQALYGRTSRLLGPAHGLAGNVHALRGYVGDEILRTRVARVLDRHAMREENMINWLPSVEPPEPLDRIRVQWCHGAPGLVATLGDLMPLELALGGGELTWQAGPLRKGPGLCHGTAGNGYALLRLFALTGEELWLDRARRFAMHAIAQVERERDRYGQGRYSLWTGDLGAAMYLRSCLSADPAFPTIDFW